MIINFLKKDEFIWVIICLLGVVALGLKYFALSITILLAGTIYFLIGFFSKQEKASPLYFFFCMFLVNIYIFASIYRQLGLTAPDELPLRVIDYYYFSVVTWTTLGFGDITPNLDTRVYAAVQALLGYLYMGLFVGKIIHVLSIRENQKSNKSLKQDK